jgi:DNA (cytosine-5)-methyltransferase 1
MGAYYNEFDPKAAQWLRQLIKNGVIADGEVDERSIIDVQADDLRGFTQHHFFAGIGGWSYALRLAGWDDTRPVCTASLPCQPFSVAGSQKGIDDERHLLPHFIELVKQCNFQTIFGEQVPGAIKHGWSDDLSSEMESEGYACGQIILTAAGAGAPHIRQRLYWGADSSATRLQGHGRPEQESVSPRWKGAERYDSQSCSVSGLSNTENRNGRPESQLATSNGRKSRDQFGGDGSCSGLGNTKLHGYDARQIGRSIGESETEGWMLEPEGSNTEWVYCRDEKYRPIKSGIEPLANGLSKGMVYSGNPSESIDADNTQEARVMRLKGYGNAIVPQVAASFIKAFITTTH